MRPSKPAFTLKGKRLWVAGHSGMVGAAIVRRLKYEGCEVLTAARRDVDLTNQRETERWMEAARPDAVFLCAARVGGIYANSSFPAEFIADNLAIGLNVIRASYRVGVAKLLNLGSSCIYPRDAAQPMPESALLTGPLEPTNEWYAIAKIAAIKLCQAYRLQYGADFISLMPTNLFGPGDNYDPNYGHAPAGLIRRFHEAKVERRGVVKVWGSGRQRREFLSVDDLADACIHLMKTYSGVEIVNVGTGRDISIGEFAKLVADVVGFEGNIEFDTSRPDGPKQKLLDVRKLTESGWSARRELRDALCEAYADFLAREKSSWSRGQGAVPMRGVMLAGESSGLAAIGADQAS